MKYEFEVYDKIFELMNRKLRLRFTYHDVKMPKRVRKEIHDIQMELKALYWVLRI